MKTISKLLLATALFAAGSAHAAVINSIDGGTLLPFSPLDHASYMGPVSENGFTWTSTYEYSLYGYTGYYGLGGNGGWFDFSHIGLNIYDDPDQDGSRFMTITFDSPVSSVLAFLNHSSYDYYGAGAWMAIYDENNALLEKYFLNISTPNGINAGEDWGFSQPTANIKSFVLGDTYIVAANLRVARDLGQDPGNAVPEPTSLALLGLGLAGLSLSRRKRKA